MSDNVSIDPSTAPSAVDVATDDVGGRHYQIVKLAIGADGSATLIDDAGLPITAAALPLPAGASTEATLAALKTVVDTIATAAAAIKVAAEALDAKTTAVNTGAIAGTVALDATALAAITAAATPGTQPISGNVGVLGAVEIVNDAGNAIPVSAAALPLPADAASETTLAAVNAKLPVLSGGRVPVELPAGGSGLTDAELRAQPLEVDVVLVLRQLLEAIANPTHVDPATAAMRVLFPSAQAVTISSGTVTAVTTCATVTNLAQVGGVNAASLVADIADVSWGQCVRERYAVTA